MKTSPVTRTAESSRPAPQVAAWDRPVVDALDRIEAIIGTDLIVWDNFTFGGLLHRPQSAAIGAYPLTDPGASAVWIRAVADHPGTVMFTCAGRPLTAVEIAHHLGLTTEQAQLVIDELTLALSEATTRFNTHHRSSRIPPASR